MKLSRNFARCLVAGSALLTGAAALAATGPQKQAAIDNGLAWLASQQAGDGGWCQSGFCDADTASAMLAFIEQRTKPAGWNGQDYSNTVTRGLQFLLDRAGFFPAGMRSDSALADQNGNGQGLIWGDWESTYVTGMVLPALSRAVTAGFVAPDDVVLGPNPWAGGQTWRTVIQDTVDTFLQGQTTANNAVNPGYRGGWRYTPSTGDSDGSTAQWPVIGMTFAQTVPGVVVPAYTKLELKNWIDFIQSSANGASGYNDPSGGSVPQSESKTGGLLVEMAFSGYDGNGGTPFDTGGLSNKAGALAYLNANWQQPPGGWTGNFGHPYAMWSIYKGLESTIGLTDTTTITNLLGCGPLDPGTSCNWWEDYSQYLVGAQAGDGSWPGYEFWPQDLATAWYVNILNGTQVGPGPDLPEPATLALLGLGGLLLGNARRRVRA